MCAHHVCLVRIRVDIGKGRVLLSHETSHEHEFHHYIFRPTQPSFGWSLFRRWNADMDQESHFMSQLLQAMFRQHLFSNSSCQGVLFCFDHADKAAFPLRNSTACTLPRLMLLMLSCPAAVCKHLARGTSVTFARCAARPSRRLQWDST